MRAQGLHLPGGQASEAVSEVQVTLLEREARDAEARASAEGRRAMTLPEAVLLFCLYFLVGMLLVRLSRPPGGGGK